MAVGQHHWDPIVGSACHIQAGGQNQWDPILVGRCTTQFRTDFSGDVFIGGTTWILTHGHMRHIMRTLTLIFFSIALLTIDREMALSSQAGHRRLKDGQSLGRWL